MRTGDVAIAAITSCTKHVKKPLRHGRRGLVAKKRSRRGLTVPKFVKTSLAPGSKVVTDYLDKAGTHALLERTRIQYGRIRLYDMYRKLRTA